MSIKKLIVLMGLCVLFTGCSTARLSSDGMQAYHESDSTADVGIRYLLGRGVAQSDVKAFYYFSRAAEEGDPFAQNELAYLYAAGRGTSVDESEAFHWYQKAAKSGLASAEYNLGFMYHYGIGTLPNKALALEWYQKSAAHGFLPARTALQQYRD